MQKMRVYIMLTVASVMITGCSAKCSCPECPTKTSVVTPSDSATVVTSP